LARLPPATPARRGVRLLGCRNFKEHLLSSPPGCTGTAGDYAEAVGNLRHRYWD
jgi:hypothetical protein